MRYFVTHDEMGYIVMRAAESPESLPDPSTWREVTNPKKHVLGAGIVNLDRGGRFVFAADDQSYPQLKALLESS